MAANDMKITEIYIRVTTEDGENKDTIQHAAETRADAIAFLERLSEEKPKKAKKKGND